jgi:hypothetical protein
MVGELENYNNIFLKKIFFCLLKKKKKNLNPFFPNPHPLPPPAAAYIHRLNRKRMRMDNNEQHVNV